MIVKLSNETEKETVIYSNQWCKVINKGTIYILRSRKGNYNDQYHTSLKELCKQAGLDYKTVINSHA